MTEFQGELRKQNEPPEPEKKAEDNEHGAKMDEDEADKGDKDTVIVDGEKEEEEEEKRVQHAGDKAADIKV